MAEKPLIIMNNKKKTGSLGVGKPIKEFGGASQHIDNVQKRLAEINRSAKN